jgi:hypothetical protein
MGKIDPAKSTRTFRKPARIVREAWSLGLIREGNHCLEIGAGCLRNANWLLKKGVLVDVVENISVIQKYPRRYSLFQQKGGQVFDSTAWPRKLYDIIVCTFVLGVIIKKTERKRLLERMRDRLQKNGVLLLSVRGLGDVKTKTRKGRKWRDGFITPNWTFVKPFTRKEIIKLAESCNLKPHPETKKIRSNSGIIDLVLVRGK